MKKRQVLFGALFLNLFFTMSIFAQADVKADSTGLPGDNFSLQGAMDLFSKAETPADFEKALNDEKNNVNNLDLNGDGQIDYIKVIDRKENDVHAIVLQAVISEKEDQDIAVIEIEKRGNDDAIAQIVGDQDIYGKDVYVEPAMDDSKYDTRVNSDIKSGPAASEYKAPVRLYFNVWGWPCVRYMYRPVYVVYVSPWYWHRYPTWWNPWRPVYWHYFYPRTYHYHNHYHVISQPRCYKARAAYQPHRVTSNTVRVRNEKVVTHYRTTNKIVVRDNDSRGRNTNRVETRSNVDTRDRGRTRSDNQPNDNRDRQRSQPTEQRSDRSNPDVKRNPSKERQRNDAPQRSESKPERSREQSAQPQRSDAPQRSESTPSRVREQRTQPQRSDRAPGPQRSDVNRSERSKSQPAPAQSRSTSPKGRTGRG